jgi:hypothetical protein
MKSPHNVILSFIICILFSVALTSCSKNLTRTEAQRQLESSYTPKGDYTYITTGLQGIGVADMSYVTIPTGELRTYLPKEAALSDAGLLKITVSASGVTDPIFGNRVADHIVITPTEKAKPFLAGTFPVGSSEFRNGCIELLAATPTIAILGISEPAEGFGKKMCSVKFQVSWKNTQVGDIIKSDRSVSEEQATFVQYDNGWRLEK